MDGRNCLSKIITLATPFAEARPSERDIRELRARYMALRFGWVPILVFLLVLYLFKVSDPHTGLESAILVFLEYEMAMVAVVMPTFIIFWMVGVIKFRSPGQQEIFRSIGQLYAIRVYVIRAPRDEAIIAINTSQFIDFMSRLLFARGIIFPFDWIRARLTRDSWSKLLRLWLILGTLTFFLIEGILIIVINPQHFSELAGPFDDWISLQYLLVGQFMLSMIVPPVLIGEFITTIFVFIVLAGPIILIPANVVLAVALGGDVMRYRGLMEIECEQFPSGITATVSTISLSEDERNRLGLVHFIHETQAARSRVAEILRAT